MSLVKQSDLARRVFIGAFTGIGMRIVGAFCQFALTAMVVRIWDSATFGMWSLILSTSLLLAGLDFGIGGSLQNRLAAQKEGRESIFWGAFALFSIIALIISTLSFLILGHRQPLFATLISLMALKYPLSLSFSYFLAAQRADVVAVLEGIGRICGVALVCIGLHLQWSFHLIVFCYLFTLILPACVGMLPVIWTLRPHLRDFSDLKRTFLDLRSDALSLWILNLFSLIVLSADNWILASIIGLESIGDVVNVRRLYNLILLINWSIISPTWSAYTLSFSNGEMGWIKKACLTTLCSVCLVNFLIGGWLYLFHPWVLGVWTGTATTCYTLSLVFWISTFVLSINATVSTLLNGLRIIWPQVAAGAVGVLLKCFLSVYWCKVYGATGVVAATAVVFAALAVFNACLIARRVKL